MRQTRVVDSLPNAKAMQDCHVEPPGRATDPIEELQLARLAGAVLSKSPADLAALAEANPLIVWEWMEAFRRQKLAAEAEARRWSAAIAAIATATPDAVRTAAE
jgi:hypothetical protein